MSEKQVNTSPGAQTYKCEGCKKEISESEKFSCKYCKKPFCKNCCFEYPFDVSGVDYHYCKGCKEKHMMELDEKEAEAMRTDAALYNPYTLQFDS